MTEEIEAHVLKKYEILQKLGKSTSFEPLTRTLYDLVCSLSKLYELKFRDSNCFAQKKGNKKPADDDDALLDAAIADNTRMKEQAEAAAADLGSSVSADSGGGTHSAYHSGGTRTEWNSQCWRSQQLHVPDVNPSPGS